MTHARDFEAAKLEANHAQVVNLVMNRSSDLNSKLKQFNSESSIQSRAISKHLPAYNTATNLSANNISTANLSAAATNNLSIAATSYLSATASSDLSTPTSSNATPKLSYNDIRKPEIQNHPKLEISNGCLSGQQSRSRQRNSGISSTQNPNSQNYLSLLITPEDVTSNNPKLNQQPTILINNIPPAIITNDESLAAIFPFELKEVTSVSLFNRTALEKKPITAMYTDVKVDGHSIKLILDNSSADSIITRQLIDQLGHRVDRAASAKIIIANGATKMPIGKIDNFPIEVNGIITPIKVLVMEATQYQALVGNDWLSKNNAVLDWTTQELQLSQNDQHMQISVMCGHFKPNNVTTSVLLIDLEKEKLKPTWKVYQVLWADVNHNELLPILTWNDDNNEKEEQGKEPTWRTTIDAWTDDKDHHELPPILS
ncbi:hypothetical protein G9A89_020184 [Geosiphon pyriformis]|nr:hypothetical protein G9A89_020184 [Geosiphon pyriformis]